jgi:hypothetical protein
MKIEFNDKSFLEVIKSPEPGKIIISIQAKDYENPLKKITNSVEITEEQFKQIIGDFLSRRSN